MFCGSVLKRVSIYVFKHLKERNSFFLWQHDRQKGILLYHSQTVNVAKDRKGIRCEKYIDGKAAAEKEEEQISRSPEGVLTYP